MHVYSYSVMKTALSGVKRDWQYPLIRCFFVPYHKKKSKMRRGGVELICCKNGKCDDINLP